LTVNVSDFEPGLRALEAIGLRGAAADIRTVTLEDVQVYYGVAERRRGAEFETQQQAARRSFGRFVTLLDRYGREGVREVAFYSIGSDATEWSFDEADQARMFGEVLPNLPFLETLRFPCATLPIAHLRTFASRLSATSSLVELDLDRCYGDFLAFVPDLAAMMRRNVPIRVLKMNARKGIDRDTCRQLFRSLQYNSNLRRLDVSVEEVYDDGALHLPTNEGSALRHLSIDVETWTREGKASLARQLKTNALLEALQVIHRNTIRITHRPWVEMLASHNFTLRSLREQSCSRYGVRRPHMGDRIPRYLNRNGRVQQALGGLPGYHVALAVLWPRVLGMVSGLPALLYRFVRLGDLNALVDLLVATHGSNKRSRPPPPPRRSSRRVGRLRK
jgi:hypothetical protein